MFKKSSLKKKLKCKKIKIEKIILKMFFLKTKRVKEQALSFNLTFVDMERKSHDMKVVRVQGSLLLFLFSSLKTISSFFILKNLFLFYF